MTRGRTTGAPIHGIPALAGLVAQVRTVPEFHHRITLSELSTQYWQVHKRRIRRIPVPHQKQRTPNPHVWGSCQNGSEVLQVDPFARPFTLCLAKTRQQISVAKSGLGYSEINHLVFCSRVPCSFFRLIFLRRQLDPITGG